MGFPNDDVRRELRAQDQDHKAELKAERERLLRRLDNGQDRDASAIGGSAVGHPAVAGAGGSAVGDPAVAGAGAGAGGWAAGGNRAAALLGPLGRRRFLGIGGFAVATAAVVAACGKTHTAQVPQAGTAPVTTALPTQVITDEVLLRTSSSVEHTLIDTYTALLGMNLGPDVTDALKRFQDQHNDHAQLFEQLTKSVGGQPYTQANPVVKTNVIDPVMALAKSDGNKPQDLVIIAHALENLAAGTYQQFVPILTVPSLRSSTMSVGGVEARHAAILAKLINGAKVVAVPTDLSPTTTAAASTVAGATTTTAATNAASTYQIPGPFGSLAPVPLTLMGQSTPIDLLGPNSYMYDQTS